MFITTVIHHPLLTKKYFYKKVKKDHNNNNITFFCQKTMFIALFTLSLIAQTAIYCSMQSSVDNYFLIGNATYCCCVPYGVMKINISYQFT